MANYDNKHFLDQEGLEKVWAAVKGKVSSRELEILPVSVYGFDTNLRVNQQIAGSALVDKVIQATNVDKKQVVIKSGDYKYNVISIVQDDVKGLRGFAIETMAIDLDSTELKNEEPAIEKCAFLYSTLLQKTYTFYGIEYTTKQIDQIVALLSAAIESETEARRLADEKKVDKEITSTSGKAIIFNEKDGGGAKFEHEDGTWSYTGVNDGGANGLAAQVYAINHDTNKGSKLDVTTGGIFYTTGDKSALTPAQRDVAANELATKGDISQYSMVKDADPGQYASVYHLTKDGQNIGAPIEIAKDQLLKSVTVKECTEKDKPIPGLNPGDKYIDFEFETTTGTTHSYIAVKDLVKPYKGDEETIHLSEDNIFSVIEIGIDKVTNLRTELDSEATIRAAEDAKKVDKSVTLPSGAKSEISNTVGQEGAVMYVDNATYVSAVAANDGGEGIGAQLYNWKKSGSTLVSGSVIDVTQSGVYYYNGNYVAASERDKDEYKLVVGGDRITDSELEDILK